MLNKIEPWLRHMHKSFCPIRDDYADESRYTLVDGIDSDGDEAGIGLMCDLCLASVGIKRSELKRLLMSCFKENEYREDDDVTHN